MAILVSKISTNDKQQWQEMYHQYADFYHMPMDSKILDNVWQWIFDEEHSFFALIAKNEAGDAMGFMHCRSMPSPIRGTYVGFLDDVFVKPESRGSGCVQALYKGLDKIAKENNWPFIRWITAEDNYRGRALYDKISKQTQWVTYQMPIED